MNIPRCHTVPEQVEQAALKLAQAHATEVVAVEFDFVHVWETQDRARKLVAVFHVITGIQRFFVMPMAGDIDALLVIDETCLTDAAAVAAFHRLAGQCEIGRAHV